MRIERTNIFRSRRRARAAFTLMEIMLAVAIFAVVLVAINGVFFSALRLRARTSAALDSSAAIEQALTVIRRDLANAVPPGTSLAGSLQSGVVSGTLSQNNGLELYTTTGSLNENVPWSDIQKVTYQLQEPTTRSSGTGKDLVRGVTRNLLAVTVEEEAQWLLGNVEQLEFSYYDGLTWRDTWDSTVGETNLPTAVKVRIQMASETRRLARPDDAIELVVPLMAQARTNAATATE